MDIREKLVELLMQVSDNMCDDCGREPVGCAVVAIADHLIANNVTVQEFGDWAVTKKRKFIEANKAEEQLQKDALGYGGRVVLNVECSACRKTTMVQETIGLYNYCPHCGAKMLPQPPKGE